MARPPFLLPLALALAPQPAAAQALDARPQGGRVVEGQASIAQSGSLTQVTQGSDRAVLEWQRFDIGARHRVDIRQPTAGSWSLQRVTGGDPSAIAGRLTSNGGVALVNPAGVMFSQGAQVDVAALIATASDITNRNFMAGRMAFDGAPRPGARVENHGSITVAEGGLAALVGPTVANTGAIRARLGRVALAGGEAFALDLAGDGLLALDVTRQVTTAASGAPALVTQSGTIDASGGSVVLTAHAASGVIETLVSTGGTTTATRIALRAEGGDIAITGRMQSPGGMITAGASGAVALAPGARVSANGAASGGQVALTGGAVSVARGARVTADAQGTGHGAGPMAGNGGSITLDSTRRTALHGTLSAQGAGSGSGGRIAVSSRGALAIDGGMKAGATGQVVIDPVTLRVVSRLSGTTEPAEVTAASINATTGALTLQADAAILVEAAINKTSGALTLETTNPGATSGEGIQILAPVRVTGDLVLRSAGDITQAATGAALNTGTLEAHSATGAVRLEASTNVIRAIAGGSAASRFGVASTRAMAADGAVSAVDIGIATTQTLTLRAPVTASGTMDLAGLRGITQMDTGAAVTAALLRLESPLGAVVLTGAGNRVTTLGDASVQAGLSLTNDGAMNVGGSLNGGRIVLTTLTGDLTQDPAASRIVAEELRLVAEAGSVLFDSTLNAIPLLQGRARDGFLVDAGGSVVLSAPVSGMTVELRSAGDLAQDFGAVVTAGLLRLSVAGNAILDDPANSIAALGGSTAGGTLALATSGALSLEGAIGAGSLSLTAAGDITAGASAALTTPFLRVTSRTGLVGLGNDGHAVDALGGSGAMGDFTLATGTALRVAAPLDAGGTLRLSAASLALDAAVTAGAAFLTATAGDITQTPEGGIAAARLITAAPIGNVALAVGDNRIPRFGGGAAGDFALATAGDAAPDAVAGLVAGRLALTIAGGLVQASGDAPVVADRLSAAVGGRIDLRAAGNAIASLGTITAPGGLALTTTTGLLLALPLELGEASLTAAGTLAQLPGATLSIARLRAVSTGGDVLLEEGSNALPRLLGGSASGQFRLSTGGALSIEAPVAAGGLLALQAAGDITQSGTGAGLSAPLLRVGSLGGSVALTGAGNAVLALETGFALGEFALAQEGALPLGIAGLLSAPVVSLRTESGVVDQPGGTLRAGLLRLDTTGDVRLDAASAHVVEALGGRTGGLALATDSALAVTEGLNAGGLLALGAEAIAIQAPLLAAGATLLARAGDITQAATGAGMLLGAAGLAASASGAITLEGAGNGLTRLAAASAGGRIGIADAGVLTVAGAITGQDLVLRAAVTLSLDGAALVAGRAVLLGAPGGLGTGLTSTLTGRDPALLPVMIVDTRRGGALVDIPPSVAADLPGLPASLQPTQLASFGVAAAAAAGSAVFDLAVGASPVFLLLDAGSALGVLEAGRLGVLASGGSAFILGALGGASGATAAQAVTVAEARAGYLFNGCVMGLATCAPVVQEAPGPAVTTTPEVVTTVVGGTAATPSAALVSPAPAMLAPLRLLAGDLRVGNPEAPQAWLPLLTRRLEDDEATP